MHNTFLNNTNGNRMAHKLISVTSTTERVTPWAQTPLNKTARPENKPRPFFMDPELEKSINPSYIAGIEHRHGSFITTEFADIVSMATLKYERIIQDIMSNDPATSIKSLTSLMKYISSRHFTDPANTTRVLLALTKKISQSEDQSEKIKLAMAFKETLKGNPNYTRTMLKELNLVQINSDYHLQTQENISGFDNKVYDSYTTGRKTTAQLIMDAYIKGLSEITIFHTNTLYLEGIKHGLDIANILEVKVRFGFDFSSGPINARLHFNIYPPENFRIAGDYASFKNTLSDFFDLLKDNQVKKNAQVIRLMDNFNKTGRILINNRLQLYLDNPLKAELFSVRKITKQDLNELGTVNYSKVHLAIILEEKYRNSLENLKTIIKQGLYWEKNKNSTRHEALTLKLKQIRSQLENLNVDQLMSEFFSDKQINYDATIPELNTQLLKIKQTKGMIVLAQPLVLGMKKTIDTIISLNGEDNRTGKPLLDGIEVYNTRISHDKNVDFFHDLLGIINWINEKNVEIKKEGIPEVEAILQKYYDPKTNIKEIIEKLAKIKKPLASVCGSDSNGHTPSNVPGMGFYVPEIRKNHQPELVSLQLNDVIQNSVYNNISFGSIYSQITTPYSGTGNPAYAGVQETPFSEIYTLRTTPAKDSEAAKFRLPLMTYAANMHPIMKTILKVAAAFGAALAIPHLGIGLADTLIWFGIGAVRSYVTQMVVKRGWDPRQWNLRYFDYNNAADAMLFTGLYIPTLNILDKLNEPGILKAGILTIGNAFFYTRIHNLFNSFSEEVAKKNLAPALAGGLASVTFDAYFTPQIALILGLPVVIASKIIYDLISFSLDSLYMSRDFLPERKENLALILDDFTKTKGEEKLHNFVDLLYEYAAAPKGKKALEEILTGSSTEAAQIKALRKFNNASQNIKRIHVYLQTLCGDDREKYTRLTGTFDHAIKDLPEFLSQIATRKRKKSITEIQKEFTKNLRIITDNLDIINQRRAYISNSAIKQSQATINTELEIIIKSVANSYSVIGANLDTSLSDHATAIALLAAVKKIAKSHRLQLESYVKKLEESKIDFMQREEYQPVIQKIMNILYYTKKELPSQKP